jgi:hypothetical protein
MPQTLLDITDDLSALDDLLVEAGGDISDPAVSAAVDAWLDELGTALERKVDGYAALITTIEHRAEGRKAEAKRMADRARIDEASAASLRMRLKIALEARGIGKVETDRFRVSVQCSGGKQPVAVFGAIDQLPEWAKRIKTIVEPDKDKIRERLEAGDTLEFAVLQPRGTRLAIK